MARLYIGSQLAQDVFVGSNRVKAIYKGSQLIYSKYQPDDVIFERNTAGTYSLNLLVSGIYEVYVIGGGTGSNAGTCRKSSSSTLSLHYYGLSGSSGAGFIGQVRLDAGTYNIVVGAKSNGIGSNSGGTNKVIANAGNSSIGNAVIAYGGVGGYADTRQPHSNFNDIPHQICTGGAYPTVNVTIVSTTLQVAGNNGKWQATSGYVAGGASVYNNYGKGGACDYDSYSNDGVAGYVKIIYKGV